MMETPPITHFNSSKYHKTTTVWARFSRNYWFYIFADNYELWGRLFQKPQMTECFKIDRDYDKDGPLVGADVA